MTGSAGNERKPSGPPPALLTGAVADALRATGGHTGGVYLCSTTSRLLRLAVLAGLPGPLFRPWWRVHMDRPFPVADVYRTGVPVVLANATEMMRHYAQLAAGLPFQFGSLYVPVVADGRSFGVLAVLRPAAADAAEVQAERERLTVVADDLGAALLRLGADDGDVTWDEEPLCVRPPAAGPAPGRVGRFSWDPATDVVTLDEQARALLGLPPDEFPGTLEALARAVDPTDAHRLPGLLHRTARGGRRRCRSRCAPPRADCGSSNCGMRRSWRPTRAMPPPRPPPCPAPSPASSSIRARAPWPTEPPTSSRRGCSVSTGWGSSSTPTRGPGTSWACRGTSWSAGRCGRPCRG